MARQGYFLIPYYSELISVTFDIASPTEVVLTTVKRI